MNPYALTRRSALLALSATIVSPSVMAQQIKPVIRIQGMNVAGGEERHITRRRIVGIRKGPVWGPSDCGVQSD